MFACDLGRLELDAEGRIRPAMGTWSGRDTRDDGNREGRIDGVRWTKGVSKDPKRKDSTRGSGAAGYVYPLSAWNCPYLVAHKHINCWEYPRLEPKGLEKFR